MQENPVEPQQPGQGAAASSGHSRSIVSANGGGEWATAAEERLSTGSLEQGFGSRGPSGKSGGPGHFVPSELNGPKFTIGHLCNIMTTQPRLSYHIHLGWERGGGGSIMSGRYLVFFFLVCFFFKNKVMLRVCMCMGSKLRP